MPTQVIWSTSLSKGATLCLYHVLKDLKDFLAIFFWHTLSRPERFHILVLTKLKGLSADSQYDSEVRSCKFELLLLLFLLGCSSWKILGKFIFFFLNSCNVLINSSEFIWGDFHRTVSLFICLYGVTIFPKSFSSCVYFKWQIVFCSYNLLLSHGVMFSVLHSKHIMK